MDICVFGSASDSIEKKYIEAGELLGERLGERGHNLVFGGGSAGLMGAVARGIRKGKGKILGVIPKFFEEKGYESIDYTCDKLIRTQTMAERKATMSGACDGYIVTPGGIGTFEEFFEVLTLKQLGVHKKPIVIFDVDGYYEDINRAFLSAMEKSFVRENCAKLYKTFSKVEEVIDYLENYSKEKQEWSLLK